MLSKSTAFIIQYNCHFYRFLFKVLYPISSLRRLYFWKEYYLRYDEIAVSSGVGDLDEFEDKNEV